jgi:ubiquinone/menaquinone biosynthesis C-methylase UbiE
MDRRAAEVYRCPYSKQPLTLQAESDDRGEVLSGALISESGRRYPITDGMPLLISVEDECFGEAEKREHEYYQATSHSYDAVLDWVFRSFYEDEDEVRGKMVGLLELKPNHRVLETGAGTCRDSLYIAQRLGPDGRFFVQDLSANMLQIGRRKMREAASRGQIACKTEHFVGNAAHLPFPDGYFDAAFHFGGLNLFTDRRKALAEMTRVVHVGGKVVAGDEGIGPWHRNTTYGDILMNSSKLYQYHAPIDCLPECARDVCVRWVLGNAYYLLEFRVGEGPPRLDLDLPIQGKRGGTHRTRYYGVLEGVTVEAKNLVHKAAEASGLTIHEWLDAAVRKEAVRTFQRDDPEGDEGKADAA